MSEALQTISTTVSVICMIFLAILVLEVRTPTGAAVLEDQCSLREIRYADGCCKDLNFNEICDEHENLGTDVCKDTNDNGMCDEIEDLVNQEDLVNITPFSLQTQSVSNMREGFTVAIDGYEYVVHEDWGKITRVNFTITNKGDHAIRPIVEVDVFDKGTPGSYRAPYVNIDTTLAPGEFIVMPAYIDVSFSNLNVTKFIELTLKDSSTWPYNPIVSVKTSFNAR